VDASLAWHMDTRGGSALELFVEGRNLLDEEARVHTSPLKDLAPMPGRGVSFGVRAFFWAVGGAWSGRGPGRAVGAQAVHFQRLRPRREAVGAGAQLQGRDHVLVLELPGTLAGIADQERDRVRLRTRVVAGDEGVDRRQLV